MGASSMSHEDEAGARIWLEAAREHEAAAALSQNPLRVRCFHGQRAVELALKALLVWHGVRYPNTHALNRLIELIPVDVPDAVDLAQQLTTYAVQEMYPDTFSPVTVEDAETAAELARVVVIWAASFIGHDAAGEDDREA
jgi:HEPN domain-containing protein